MSRHGNPPLRARLIGTLTYHVNPLPESKDVQGQMLAALEAAYLMGRRDEAKDNPKILRQLANSLEATKC